MYLLTTLPTADQVSSSTEAKDHRRKRHAKTSTSIWIYQTMYKGVLSSEHFPLRDSVHRYPRKKEGKKESTSLAPPFPQAAHSFLSSNHWEHFIASQALIFADIRSFLHLPLFMSALSRNVSTPTGGS